MIDYLYKIFCNKDPPLTKKLFAVGTAIPIAKGKLVISNGVSWDISVHSGQTSCPGVVGQQNGLHGFICLFCSIFVCLFCMCVYVCFGGLYLTGIVYLFVLFLFYVLLRERT